jgi:hypothetical protein
LARDLRVRRVQPGAPATPPPGLTPGRRPLHAPRKRRGSRQTEAVRPPLLPCAAPLQPQNATTALNRSQSTALLSILPGPTVPGRVQDARQ